MRRLARGQGDQQLISTDISLQVPPTEVGTKHEPGWEKRRREHNESQARAMNLLEQMAASMGGLLALNQSAPPNDVLLQGTYLTSTQGVWAGSWEQHFAAVALANLSGHSLTLTSFAQSEAAPKTGTGVVVVPSGFFRVVPMRGSALTVYGTAASLFDIAVYIRPRTPEAGQCGLG